MRYNQCDPDMISRARRLRENMTTAERKLWSELRGRRLGGLKFRRQRPIGPYIADFVCYGPKIVVEVDGGQHGVGDMIADDFARARWLESQGFKVLRFWNIDVLQNLDSVLEKILDEAWVPDRPHRPSP